jgi:predicted amidohydrolase
MKGAELPLWQHAPERFREDYAWPALLKARALDNHSHLVAAMYADPRTYITNRYEAGWPGAAWGRSMVLNRVGVPVADTGYDEGIATAVVNLDKRKINAWAPYSRVENIFYVNNLGDRSAFRPLTEPWQKPRLPAFKKRKARIAVAHFFQPKQWVDGDMVPTEMFRALDDALRQQSDLVLLSEMGARHIDEKTNQVIPMVAERARKARAYILIGGLDTEGRRSNAWLWDREGRIVFREPIYWTEGFPEIKVYDTDFARIGVHQCGDLYLGEVDRVLALKGAEIILDPSHMWGADGYNNQLLLQARAIDNGCWMACAHTNTSDAWMRSLVVDPYGYVMGASAFQHVGAFCVDIDFDQQRVYYAGSTGRPNRSAYGPQGDLPEQRPGWREMIFARRRPELYGLLPTTNAVTNQYRQGPQNPAGTP